MLYLSIKTDRQMGTARYARNNIILILKRFIMLPQNYIDDPFVEDDILSYWSSDFDVKSKTSVMCSKL